MDYERKELVDWVRGIYQNLDEADKQDALRFFPELRESEDERIRRKLMWLLQQDICPFPEEEVIQMLNYLEKQKEQKPDDIKSEWWNKGYLEGRKNAHIPAKELGLPSSWDFQKEQKPAEKQDYSGLNDLERAIHRGFLAAGVENVPITIIKETAKECLAQMKPAEWSEEDEKFFNTALWHIGFSVSNGKQTTDCKCDTTEWFKGLRDRIKSLRPQPHWKPSEEQMSAICMAKNFFSYDPKHGDDAIASALASLESNLKKMS